MVATSHQTTSTITTIIQHRWIRKQKQTPPILHGSTSADRTTNNQPQVLPIRLRRTESHTRIPLVRRIPTTYRLEKRMDRYYSTSDHIQCIQHCKGKIYAPTTKTPKPPKGAILHWMSNYHCTSREPAIKNPRRIPTTPQSIQ